MAIWNDTTSVQKGTTEASQQSLLAYNDILLPQPCIALLKINSLFSANYLLNTDDSLKI
jgi:hypothetical protein